MGMYRVIEKGKWKNLKLAKGYIMRQREREKMRFLCVKCKFQTNSRVHANAKFLFKIADEVLKTYGNCKNIWVVNKNLVFVLTTYIACDKLRLTAKFKFTNYTR